jgi:hypothetical protein
MPNSGYPRHRVKVYSLDGTHDDEEWLLCLDRCIGCLSYVVHVPPEHTSPETFIFHVDCRNLFNKLLITHSWLSRDQLWRIGRATSPWFSLTSSETEGKPLRAGIHLMVKTMDKGGTTQQLIHHLVQLPGEIFDMIWPQIAENSILNRFAMVFTWSKDIIAAGETQKGIDNNRFLGCQYLTGHQSLSLCLASCSKFRLGVDHLGIQTFQDLTQVSTLVPRSKSPWYIVRRSSSEVFSSVG